jgi:hypothetical protein
MDQIGVFKFTLLEHMEQMEHVLSVKNPTDGCSGARQP